VKALTQLPVGVEDPAQQKRGNVLRRRAPVAEFILKRLDRRAKKSCIARDRNLHVFILHYPVCSFLDRVDESRTCPLDQLPRNLIALFRINRTTDRGPARGLSRLLRRA
jgi:hypothetical protein